MDFSNKMMGGDELDDLMDNGRDLDEQGI